MSLKHEMVKSNLYSFLSRIITVIGAFALSIYMARVLQPYEFGLYTLALTVSVFASMFTDFGYKTALVRFMAHHISVNEFGKGKAVFKYIMKIKIILTLLTAGILIIFDRTIALYFFNKIEIAPIIALSGGILIAESAFVYANNILRSFRNFKMQSFSDVMNIVFKIVFVVILINLGMMADGAVLGVIISLALAALVTIFYCLKKYKHFFIAKVEQIDKKELHKFSFWAIIALIAYTFDATVDKMMIGMFLPVEAVGFYGIGSTWSSAIITMVPISYSVLFPFLSMNRDRETINKMLLEGARYLMMFTVPMAFLLSAFSDSFIDILYKASYAPAITVLSILSFASIPLMLIGLLNTFFESVNKPKFGAMTYLTMMILNLIGNYFAIMYFGINGVAANTLILAVVQVMIFVVIVSREEKIKFSFRPLIKPFVAIVPAYLVCLSLPVTTSIFTLILYGLLGIGIYGLVMLAIKGIRKHDIELILSVLKRQ